MINLGLEMDGESIVNYSWADKFNVCGSVKSYKVQGQNSILTLVKHISLNIGSNVNLCWTCKMKISFSRTTIEIDSY